MNIAIIPARGGSKRIPRKNIRTFCGKPMIAWSLEAAHESSLFDHIIVSTDDEEIAEVARAWGAEVPFARPADLSNDHASTTDVVAHAARWACDQGWKPAAVCCLYATAPFIHKDDLARGLQTLNLGDWSYTFSATEFAASIFRAFKEVQNGGVEMFFPENIAARSQDLPVALHDAAQFYWGRLDAWLNGEPIFGKSSKPILIPRWRVQDIDTPDDWTRAEMIASAIIEKNS
jgi:N-acylneuraminate cytidylyltransferase